MDGLSLDVYNLAVFFFQGPAGQRGPEGPPGKPGEDVSQLFDFKVIVKGHHTSFHS